MQANWGTTNTKLGKARGARAHKCSRQQRGCGGHRPGFTYPPLLGLGDTAWPPQRNALPQVQHEEARTGHVCALLPFPDPAFRVLSAPFPKLLAARYASPPLPALVLLLVVPIFPLHPSVCFSAMLLDHSETSSLLLIFQKGWPPSKQSIWVPLPDKRHTWCSHFCKKT